MLDQSDFDADLLALELLDRLDARPRDDHVVAVGVVGGHDHQIARTTRAGHERVAVGDEITVNLAGRERIHRCRVVEPIEIDIEPSFLEPTLVDRHLPGYPAWPVAIAQAHRGGAGRSRPEQGHAQQQRAHKAWSY